MMLSTVVVAILLTCCRALIMYDTIYEITVYTGKESWAGTNAAVYIKLFGSNGVSELKRLPTDTKYFEKGGIDKFDVTFDKNIGDIYKIRIGHDGAHMYADWKLDEVRVRRYNSLQTSRFFIKRWLKKEYKKSTRLVEATKVEKEECGRSPVQPRVVMGDTSAKGQWPWQVQIRTVDMEHWCGGTLVHPQWVVTASHCVFDDQDPKKYTLTLGEHNRYQHEKTEQRFGIAQMIVHPKYNDKIVNNDITLIKLDRPAILTQDIKLACLPSSGYQLPAGEDCFVSGWGSTHAGSAAPVVLQHARLPSVSNKECYSNMKYIGKITDEMICGGGNNRGGCQGDSGGPYVCLNMRGQFVLQGVVSWGTKNCDAYRHYTAFARVGKFVDWIEHNIYAKYIESF